MPEYGSSYCRHPYCNDVSGEKPGEDDNASGVVGLLECAKLFDDQKPEFDYKIDFVVFTLEEPPYFGTTNMGGFYVAF